MQRRLIRTVATVAGVSVLAILAAARSHAAPKMCLGLDVWEHAYVMAEIQPLGGGRLRVGWQAMGMTTVDEPGSPLDGLPLEVEQRALVQLAFTSGHATFGAAKFELRFAEPLPDDEIQSQVQADPNQPDRLLIMTRVRGMTMLMGLPGSALDGSDAGVVLVSAVDFEPPLSSTFGELKGTVVIVLHLMTPSGELRESEFRGRLRGVMEVVGNVGLAMLEVRASSRGGVKLRMMLSGYCDMTVDGGGWTSLMVDDAELQTHN